MGHTHDTTPAARLAAADAAVASAWSALVAAATAESDARVWDGTAARLWATRGARVSHTIGDPQTPATQAAARRHTRALAAARRAERATW